MSAESLAAFRNQRSQELRQLAEQHLQHDLTQSDRDTLRAATKSLGTHTTVGSFLGIALGVYTAFRLRRMRLAYFNAFKAMDKPVEIRFADGRTEAVPDITPQLAPSRWGDAATYFFFTVGGLFIGGETGLLTGTWSASRSISKDPETKQRIEKAFNNYRVDLMKKEIQAVEGKSKIAEIFS